MLKRTFRTGIASLAVFMVAMCTARVEAAPSLFPRNGGDICFTNDTESEFLVLSMRPASDMLYYVVGDGVHLMIDSGVLSGACFYFGGSATFDLSSFRHKVKINLYNVDSGSTAANMQFFTLNSVSGAYEGPYSRGLVAVDCSKSTFRNGVCSNCHLVNP